MDCARVMGGIVKPERYLELLARARREFPGAFPAARSRRPLAIGSFEALVAAWPDLTKKSVRHFLDRYCAHPYYLQALAAGGPRHRLDGGVSGEVTEEQRAFARADFAARAQKKSRCGESGGRAGPRGSQRGEGAA